MSKRNNGQCYHPAPQKKESEIFALELFVNKYLWVILVVIAVFIAGWAVLQYRVDLLEAELVEHKKAIEKLAEYNVEKTLDIQSLKDQLKSFYIK